MIIDIRIPIQHLIRKEEYAAEVNEHLSHMVRGELGADVVTKHNFKYVQMMRVSPNRPQVTRQYFEYDVVRVFVSTSDDLAVVRLCYSGEIDE